MRKLNLESYISQIIPLKILLVWVVLMCAQNALAIPVNDIKKLSKTYKSIMGFIYYYRKHKYATVSRNIGSIKFKKIRKKDVPLAMTSYTSNRLTLILSTFKEFKEELQPKVNDFVLFPKLIDTINNYFQFLKIKPFDLTIELIIIPSRYTLFYKTKRRSFSENLKLTFMLGYDKKNNLFEQEYLSFIPHELFHFLIAYLKLDRNVTSLKAETYAHLFGQCVAYDINPQIVSRNYKLPLDENYFKNPQLDLLRLKKEFQNYHVEHSYFGGFIAAYYFQYIANSCDGKNISSENIPKFCQQLFAAFDYYLPIQKIPPEVLFSEI